MDNIGIMRNERKQLIETLKDLEKTRSGKYLYTGIFSACSFSVKKISLEDGFCTSYGACRFREQDYMYQVGLHLLWGL